MPAVTRSQRGATPCTLDLQRFMPVRTAQRQSCFGALLASYLCCSRLRCWTLGTSSRARAGSFNYTSEILLSCSRYALPARHRQDCLWTQSWCNFPVQVVTFEELTADFTLAITKEVSLQPETSDKKQLILEAISTASISVAWSPQMSGAMQEALHCQWDRERLKVLLYGTAAAVPLSTLMHDSVKSTILDVSSSVIQLPQTPSGQKFAKCQRIGGISPGHPTFEAAMRSATAVKPGAGTPGLSRYASEAALARAQSPVDTFAARLQRVADSPPKPIVQERPRVRPKQVSGRAPMRALKLAIQQPAAASVPTGNAAVAAPAAPVKQLVPADFKADSIAARSRTAASKGFSQFHPR